MNEQTLDSLCTINPETLGASTPMDFEFRYLDISAVTKGHIDWSATQLWKFANAPSRARRRLRPGDALLCSVRPGLQAHARIDRDEFIPLVGSTGFVVLRPNMSTDSGFIFHQLFSNNVAAQLRALETGSSYPAVNESDVRRLRFFTPEPEERKRMAVVLDTVDEAIAKTEAVIAKLKQVRAGLLHDLLTRGLDDHGHLRDPIAHPEQFQGSPLGRIPKEWTFDTLVSLCHRNAGSIQTGPFGSQLHASDYVEQGVPIITVEHLGDGVIHHVNLPRVCEDDCRRLARYQLRAGDLVFSRVGAIDRCGLVTQAEDGWLFSGRCLRVRLGAEGLDPRFFAFQLNGFRCRQWILNNAVGSTMHCLNTTILGHLPITKPPHSEQVLIANRLTLRDSHINQETAVWLKLGAAKSGLMADLLTGRVRVPEKTIGGTADDS